MPEDTCLSRIRRTGQAAHASRVGDSVWKATRRLRVRSFLAFRGVIEISRRSLRDPGEAGLQARCQVAANCAVLAQDGQVAKSVTDPTQVPLPRKVGGTGVVTPRRPRENVDQHRATGRPTRARFGRPPGMSWSPAVGDGHPWLQRPRCTRATPAAPLRSDACSGPGSGPAREPVRRGWPNPDERLVGHLS